MADTQTTTATSDAGSSQGSYVQSLLTPALEGGSDHSAEATAQPQTDATATGTAPSGSEGATSGEKTDTTGTTKVPTVDELIQNFATETGLDPSDPNQRKTLKRLADKELFIRKLQQDNEALKGTAVTAPGTTDAAPAFLTDFEKELAGEGTAAAPTGQTEGKAATPITDKTDPKAAAPAADNRPYGDVGDPWKTPEDSLTALNDAWGKNDLKTVHDIEVARLKRNFDSVIAPSFIPYIARMVEARLQSFTEKDLGDVVPEVRRTAMQRRVGESREFAIDQLRKAGANDIEKLFDAEDGPPIKFDGQEFPNTPLNRILAKHPEIMQIRGSHTDPAKAERQAFIARYKLAYQIFKQGTAGAALSAETAKALVDAGRDIKDKQQQDRARQSMNAGPGASGVGDKEKPKSYVGQLNAMPGELPFSSLL
jgi:hypothetical protein